MSSIPSLLISPALLTELIYPREPLLSCNLKPLLPSNKLKSNSALNSRLEPNISALCSKELIIISSKPSLLKSPALLTELPKLDSKPEIAKPLLPSKEDKSNSPANPIVEPKTK